MRRGLINGHFRLAATAAPRAQMKSVRLALGLGPLFIDGAECPDRGIPLQRLSYRLGWRTDRSRYEGGEAFWRRIFDRRPRFDPLIARSLVAKIPWGPTVATAVLVPSLSLIASLSLIPRSLIP